MLDAFGALGLELLLHLTLQVLLLVGAGHRYLLRLYKLRLELTDLLLHLSPGRLCHLVRGIELLLRRLGGNGLLHGIPILLPMHEARNELRTGEARAGGTKQLLLTHILRVDIMPRLPAAGKALLHDTTHADLAKVLDTLLSLGLELILHRHATLLVLDGANRRILLQRGNFVECVLQLCLKGEP